MSTHDWNTSYGDYYLIISAYSLSLPLLSLHLRNMTDASTLAGEKVFGSLSREITLSSIVLMMEGTAHEQTGNEDSQKSDQVSVLKKRRWGNSAQAFWSCNKLHPSSDRGVTSPLSSCGSITLLHPICSGSQRQTQHFTTSPQQNESCWRVHFKRNSESCPAVLSCSSGEQRNTKAENVNSHRSQFAVTLDLRCMYITWSSMFSFCGWAWQVLQLFFLSFFFFFSNLFQAFLKAENTEELK